LTKFEPKSEAAIGKSGGPQCPICHRAAAKVHALPVATIVELYQRQFQIDVTREFGDISSVGLWRCPECDFAFFSPVVAGSELLYEGLQRFPWYYQEQKPEFETARKHIKSTDRVLEVGCGSGAFARGHPLKNYVGLEFSRRAAAEARSCGIQVEHRSIEEYSALAPACFDVVCAFQVLEHVAHPGEFITACVKACRPGGKIIFSTPSADAFVNAMQNCVINMPPHHTGWFSRLFWRNLPKYYPLADVVVVDDPLDALHRQLYAKTLLIAALTRFWHDRRPTLLNAGWGMRILDRLAGLPARLLAQGLADERLQPNGASITAIYRKS
jgi:SAM-dependent methyltransferase